MKISPNVSALHTSALAHGVAAGNVANAQTAGFRADTVVQSAADTAAARPDPQPGTLTFAGNQFAVAVNGQGYLPLQMPDGTTAFSRGGGLMVDRNNTLSDLNGNMLLPGIRIPPGAGSVSIDGSGKVTATINGSPQQVGSIQLASFADPAALTDIGNGLYTASAASGVPRMNTPDSGTAGSLVMGSLEMPNVNLSADMVTMIANPNTFQYNIKAMQVQDEIYHSTLSIKA